MTTATKTINLDWATRTETLIVARHATNGVVVGYWPVGTPRPEVERELKAQAFPRGTRVSIRKEDVEIDEDNGCAL